MAPALDAFAKVLQNPRLEMTFTNFNTKKPTGDNL
jgi:hypothetical protein